MVAYLLDCDSTNTSNSKNEPKIHTYASGEMGIFANAYLVETQNGVVAIDATLTVSESKSFKSLIDSINKPLLAILLTHAHPDHVAGITNLVGTSADTPIIAVESVEKLMRTTEEAKRAQWGPVYKDEWIGKWTFPNRWVIDNDIVTFDGVTYRVHDIGPGGDSNANSIWVIEGDPQYAFVGDLVFEGTHSYIADNHVADWFKNLEKAGKLLTGVAAIYPGHGKSGSLEMLNFQKKYLMAYTDAVKELSGGESSLTESAKKELTTKMEGFLENGRLTFLIAHSANAVATELAKRG